MPYTFYYWPYILSFQNFHKLLYPFTHLLTNPLLSLQLPTDLLQHSQTFYMLLYTFFIYTSYTFHCSFSYRVWSFNHPWNPQFSFQRRHRTKSKTQTEFYKNSTQVEASSCTSASTGASTETCRSGQVSWQRHAPLPQAETLLRPKWPFLGPEWQRPSPQLVTGDLP